MCLQCAHLFPLANLDIFRRREASASSLTRPRLERERSRWREAETGWRSTLDRTRGWIEVPDRKGSRLGGCGRWKELEAGNRQRMETGGSWKEAEAGKRFEAGKRPWPERIVSRMARERKMEWTREA